jgi:hypothetical protein
VRCDADDEPRRLGAPVFMPDRCKQKSDPE